jgi:AraC-like DNA-binding protein
MDLNILPSTVATVLDPLERATVVAAAGDGFRATHAADIDGVFRALRECSVHAVLMSLRTMRRQDVPRVAQLVREFPGIPVVAVVSRLDGAASDRLLQLGASGGRMVVDLEKREGLQRLRSVVGHEATPTHARILKKVLPALGGSTTTAKQFFEVVVHLAPVTPTARELSRRLNVEASTFMSRFFRARLPSPKSYLCAVRLLHASALFEIPALTVSDVANRLDYSSPQSFGRHVRAVVGLTAGEFRERARLDHSLDAFVARMILPFQGVFRTFRPF